MNNSQHTAQYVYLPTGDQICSAPLYPIASDGTFVTESGERRAVSQEARKVLQLQATGAISLPHSLSETNAHQTLYEYENAQVAALFQDIKRLLGMEDE